VDKVFGSYGEKHTQIAFFNHTLVYGPSGWRPCRRIHHTRRALALGRLGLYFFMGQVPHEKGDTLLELVA
jgi:hypothetical protein